MTQPTQVFETWWQTLYKNHSPCLGFSMSCARSASASRSQCSPRGALLFRCFDDRRNLRNGHGAAAAKSGKERLACPHRRCSWRWETWETIPQNVPLEALALSAVRSSVMDLKFLFSVVPRNVMAKLDTPFGMHRAKAFAPATSTWWQLAKSRRRSLRLGGNVLQ